VGISYDIFFALCPRGSVKLLGTGGSPDPKAKAMNSIMEILGIIGAALLLSAYWLVSSNRIAADAAESHVLNFSGACLIALNSGYHGAWIPAGLNVVWALRAIYGIAAKRI